MTVNKNLLGNKRQALNTLADAINTNVEAASTVTVADAGGRYTGTNVETCLQEIAGSGRTTETVKANADDVDTLEGVVGTGTFGTCTLDSTGGSGGAVAITSRVPGTDGNNIEVSLTAGTAGTVTVSEAGGTYTIDVEITDTTTTAAEVATYINQDRTASALVYAAEDTVGAMDAAAAVAITGGADTVGFVEDEYSNFLTTAYFSAAARTANEYNAISLLDNATGILNQRANHFPVHRSNVVKYERMAVATYDFDVHGGEISTIDLTVSEVIPDNAIITDVVVDVVDALVTTDTGGTVTFLVPTDGDLTEAIADTAADLFSGKPGNFALDGNALTAANMGIAKAATWIKTTAARKIQAKIETKTVTAGKIDILVKYVVTE